ncbi:Conserved_hypothetical protein [Hexamita inflata]|uniref:Probable ubiquitin carboxyl-terminal hydrolase MINDY-4 n=1 Tax=Hexamita inflata TaxID=28002 RepID=A0AA86TGC9_9EUKA|nr:Conserved hypothetical protein [Hexamita inflata]
MTTTDFTLALFKEYLVLNKFEKTSEIFKQECDEKKFETTITKRLQLVTGLNLKEQMLAENEKKKQGQPCLASTLEVLIREFLNSNSEILELQDEKLKLQEMLKEAQQYSQQKEVQEGDAPAKKRVKKRVQQQDDLDPPAETDKSVVQEEVHIDKHKISTPTQLKQLGESTHERKSVRPVKKSTSSEAVDETTKKRVLPPAQAPATENIWSMQPIVQAKQKPSAASHYTLTNYINDTCGTQNFYLTLFNDKRVKSVPDNWYQSLRNTAFNQPIALNKPQTWSIHQNAGGPCGFIAAMQARICKYLFCNCKYLIGEGFTGAALSSVFETFLKISSEKFVVVLPDSFKSETIQLDRIIQEMDKFTVLQLKTVNELKQLIESKEFSNFCFQDKVSSFIPCMVLSYVFSRGVMAVRELDFDKASATAAGSIFANCNNCSQELVNLMICGRAVAGLHDNNMDLDGMILQGIPSKCDVGLLSIFEAYDYLRVGTFLKQPQYPVWVCFNEAHFTAIMGNTELLEIVEGEGGRGKTEFVYYDGLDDQKTYYRITADFDSTTYKKVESESYVENLIQTLIPATKFDWAGVDKLL